MHEIVAAQRALARLWRDVTALRGRKGGRSVDFCPAHKAWRLQSWRQIRPSFDWEGSAMKAVCQLSIVCHIAIGVAAYIVACQSDTREEQVKPPGRETTARTEVLKAGAEVVQSNLPTDKLDVYLVGFHPLKDDPRHQMEAHHYCRQVNEDFAQCALWDSNGAGANLNGIEYIISEKLFETLPPEERQYWHPHNYEILSGQLVAPGLPDVAERELMKGKINSYGKTWHVWHTGSPGMPGDALPMGEARLAWSFNADGELPPEMLRNRDQAMGIDTQEKRAHRQELVELAHPQEGVDALADAFPQRIKPAGVRDKAETQSAQMVP
jgi:hypothetical protein